MKQLINVPIMYTGLKRACSLSIDCPYFRSIECVTMEHLNSFRSSKVYHRVYGIYVGLHAEIKHECVIAYDVTHMFNYADYYSYITFLHYNRHLLCQVSGQCMVVIVLIFFFNGIVSECPIINFLNINN